MYDGAALPDLGKVDWLVILGGPMNVDDMRLHPWLKKEKEFLRDAIRASVPCLGLCLGAQLLAQTLGADVRKNANWEVGWHPVRLKSGNDLTVFQWHQDTFDLPDGAIRTATNSITENQSFLYGQHVIGTQFHPEATKAWVEEFADENPYPAGPFVQSPEQVLGGSHHLPAMRAWFFDLLEGLETLALARKRDSKHP